MKLNNIADITDHTSLLSRIHKFNYGLSELIDVSRIAENTIARLPIEFDENQLDELIAMVAASFSNLHPDYSIIGGRLLMSKLHRGLNIPNTNFFENLTKIYENNIFGRKTNRISDEVYKFVSRNKLELEKIIDYKRDFENYDYSAISSLLKRGLEYVNGVVAEVPSQMFLRVACGINTWSNTNSTSTSELLINSNYKTAFKNIKDISDSERLVRIREYYEVLSTRKISLPGPILLHAGSKNNQMASCFLEYCGDELVGDNYNQDGKVQGILKAITQLSAQSKGGAGTAVALHDIRSSNSSIAKTNGKSNGILPFMKMFDATICAVDQSGKRAGVCTVYLEPWHADILDFLDAADHFTIEEKKCKHLYFSLFVNNLFFERLVNDKAEAKWTLFNPQIISYHLEKPLSEYYGKEFEEKYQYLESLGIGKTITLMEIWGRVCKLLQTSGYPYIVNKDEMNIKSNQQNLGVIKSSNVCTEISLAANENETPVCVLSSICLSRFFDLTKKDKFDYSGLINTVRIATKNLNNVIDLQFYPTPETRNSCLRRRAIGIGAQGLADLFAMMKLDFTSKEARIINKRIYECIYFGSMIESMENAKIDGCYDGFKGSNLSKGTFQFDMWGVKNNELFLNSSDSDYILEELGMKELKGNIWNWLKSQIIQHGVRNSEVTALAPTMSSSIRMGNNEMHEPFTRNIYIRQFIGGSIQVINKYLVKDLIEINKWNDEILNQIMDNDGSVQHIQDIPKEIKNRYKTAYELDWKDLIDMMADRSVFVSQSSSYNHFVTYEESGPTAFTQRIIYAWRKGLKTLSYYFHTEAATVARKELGGKSSITQTNIENNKTLSDGAICEMKEGCIECQS
jgi:ribonucleoside-diphosphate reductase alpha chain